MQMASRLGSSNCKKKQLAISLSSFSVSKSYSQNNQNKEEQEQDNEKSKSRILLRKLWVSSVLGSGAQMASIQQRLEYNVL